MVEGRRTSLGAWPVIVGVAMMTAGLMTSAGLGFDWHSALVPVTVSMGLEGLAAFYRTRRPDARLAAMLAGVAQLVAFTAVGSLFSYAVAFDGGPLWDATLLTWDRSLGLDWLQYLAFVNERPALGLVYKIAYQSLPFQMVAIVLALGLANRIREIRDFVIVFCAALIVTVLFAGLLPAMGTYVFHGLAPSDYPNITPSAPFLHVADLRGLRDGTFRSISLANIQGIITFPSFHAAAGVILLHAFWTIRPLRWPALAINLTLIAATPIEGGHYFVDVIAGSAIALAAIGATRRRSRGMHGEPLSAPMLARPPSLAAVDGRVLRSRS